MENLVDVFYYDYILTRIIELYHGDSPSSIIIPHLKVATPLSKKFREEKIKMDREIYLKEIYIKVLQILKLYDRDFNLKPDTDEKSAIRRTLDCMELILKETPSMGNDADFIMIRNVGYSLYVKKGQNGSDQNIERFDLRMKQIEKTEYAKINEMAASFKWIEFVNLLSSVSFRNPVMKKFVSFIKDGIDGRQQEKKGIVTCNEPGDKIDWR